MKTRSALILLLLLVILLIWRYATASAAGGFEISNADATVYLGTSGSPELNTLINEVIPRFVVEMANEVKFYDLPPAPVQLLSLIGQVDARFVLQFANANRFYTLAYPAVMIGDTYPPIINLIYGSNGGIICETDEFTSLEVFYGTQPGNYTSTKTNPEYYKFHEVQLSGLVDGTTYYYKVRVFDRSGNATESAEGSFKNLTIQKVHLPLVIR